MKDKRCTKKIVLGTVFIFIILSMNVSGATQNTNETHNKAASSIFGLQSVITVSWDENQTSEPIMPYLDLRSINLNISYSVVKGILGQLMLWYYIYTKTNINVTIEIVEKPDYCIANISNSNLWFPISEMPFEKQTKLLVSVDVNATAFEPFNITIRASINNVPGPFGFFTFVNKFEQIQEISLMADYFPLIDVTPESSFIETTPGTTVIDPITIENLGNGKTIVDIEFDSVPENWSITIDPAPLIIEVEGSEITNLSVTPPLDFYGIVNIRLKFTPKFFYNPEIQGHYIYLTIEIKVNPKEKISVLL